MSRTPESTTTAAADPAAEQIFYGIMMGDGSALYESYDQLRSTAPSCPPATAAWC